MLVRHFQNLLGQSDICLLHMLAGRIANTPSRTSYNSHASEVNTSTGALQWLRLPKVPSCVLNSPFTLLVICRKAVS